ncbi:Venom metalloproteinase [Dirofilaria immitis]
MMLLNEEIVMNNYLEILKIIIAFWSNYNLFSPIRHQKINIKFQQFYNSGSFSSCYLLLPDIILLKVNCTN